MILVISIDYFWNLKLKNTKFFRPPSEERSKKVRWTEIEKGSEKQEEKLEELRAKMRDELVFQPSQVIGNFS